MNDQPKQVRLTKAWVFDGPGGVRVQKADSESQQLPEDPFNYLDGENGLVKPPFDMDALQGLLGGTPGSMGNSLHTRCVKQKSTDTLGRGIDLRAKEEEQGSSEEEDRWGTFTEEVETDDRGEGSLKERLTWAQQDFEAVGWAVIEVGRNSDGTLDGLWHVPAHTVRAHRDGRRFAQKRDGKTVWFKRFGLDGDVDAKRGGWSDSPIDSDRRGNEVIVVRNYTPVSSYYGLPDHIPALAAMAGWTAQAEFNIRFFGNQAVPSYAVIVEGADLSEDLENLIIDHFQRIKGDPARTIVIPVPAALGMSEAYQPKVRFERLSVDVKEASFRMYRQDAALEICISHGMPPYRIGWPIVGSLGGSTAEEMTNIYNDSIVQPRQETWEQRLNRWLLGPKGLDIQTWLLKCAELDVRNEMRDIDKAKGLYELGVISPRQAAQFFGYQRDDPAGNDYIAAPLSPQAGTMPVMDEVMAKMWTDEVSALRDLRTTVEKALPMELDASLSEATNGNGVHAHAVEG